MDSVEFHSIGSISPLFIFLLFSEDFPSGTLSNLRSLTQNHAVVWSYRRAWLIDFDTIRWKMRSKKSAPTASRIAGKTFGVVKFAEKHFLSRELFHRHDDISEHTMAPRVSQASTSWKSWVLYSALLNEKNKCWADTRWSVCSMSRISFTNIICSHSLTQSASTERGAEKNLWGVENSSPKTGFGEAASYSIIGEKLAWEFPLSESNLGCLACATVVA